MDRSDFLRVLAGGVLAITVPGLRSADMPVPQTYTYKSVGNLEIKADVNGGSPPARRPAVVWIHGGALIQGSRKSMPRLFQDKLLALGYVIVSIDYRLAPETKLPEIIHDLRDAFRWVHQQGPRRFGIDADRVAVAGGSAGGYLTLMAGFTTEPRPRALASFYGYGDITTPWYAEPDAFYRKQPMVSREEAENSVGRTPVAEIPQQNRRGRFYLYCRQQGIWPLQVAGHDPKKDTNWFDAYCPVRNVTPQYPPTILVHGTADTDVPYDESRNMAARLQSAGVLHEFITIPEAGHGLAGATPQQIENAYSRAAEFIREHVS